MKKILLFLMTICAFANLNTAKAQCDLAISNVKISATPGNQIGVVGSATNPVRCQYTFTAEFDLTANQGFKFLYFHTWLAADYPNPAIFNCADKNTPATSPGNVVQLGTTIWQAGKSILDFGFNDINTQAMTLDVPFDATPFIGKNKNYPNNDNNNDDTVALNKASSAFITKKPNGVYHFVITGIEVEILGACGGNNAGLAVYTDIWGANQGGAQLGTGKSKISAQCYICKQGQSFNDPTLALLPLCGPPRNYSFSITSSAVTATVYNWKVFAHDPLGSGDVQINSGTVTLSADPSDAFPTVYSSGNINAPIPFCCTSPWSEFDFRLEVTSPSFSNAVVTPNVNAGCTALPVNLKSFTANRKNASIVELKWETAQEQNSKGFYVERKLSTGAWQSVKFVETKAINGNSNSPLTYEFTDLNDAKGVSQYRLKQLDVDGKSGYSQIRSIRGEGQKANTIIYPNPSNDGKVNVLFEGANANRDVSLLDVSGRTVRQWKGVTNNNIQIDNLTAGFYTVRILNTETGEQVVEKFIVNKR